MRGAERGFSVDRGLTVIWQDGAQIRRVLEKVFNEALAGSMRQLPVINPALEVRAIGFECFGDDRPGVLLTPWFMNVLLFPGEFSSWQELASGHSFEQPFPGGRFRFTVGRQARLGSYGQCSLFSPMWQFADQDAALTAAQSALQGLLTVPAAPTLSRRDLLRGYIGTGL